MRVLFLGTNGWYDTETGNTVCTLIETENYFIILDAGNGIHKLDRHINNGKQIYLFISHFHFDHIIGLHILNKFRFIHGIHFYGQPGTKEILKRLINIPYTVPLAKLPFKVEISELSEGIHNIPFKTECRFLLHSERCMGYRYELDGKVIAYIPDTGICEKAVELARNADLIIAECSFMTGQRNMEWPHLNPEDAAQIAKEANARKLALFHFDANIYRTIQKREQAQENARKIFINTLAAVDDMEIEI